MYFVPDAAPQEDKAICELVNRGFRPGLLYKAAYTFYRANLEDQLRAKRRIEVDSGLFQGMIVSPEVLASQLLPKFLGTYEKEVQDYMCQCFEPCSRFIDIGCAEGFYVVGVSRWKGIPCLGIDINPKSESAVRYAAEANQVSSHVEFSGDISKVKDFLVDSVFCLVDVDGSEMEVLQSYNQYCDSASSLASVMLLVESDSGKTEVQNIPEIVSFLSSAGWRVESILRQDSRNRFVGSLSEYSFLEQVVRGDEGRPGGQSWIAAVKTFR